MAEPRYKRSTYNDDYPDEVGRVTEPVRAWSPYEDAAVPLVSEASRSRKRPRVTWTDRIKGASAARSVDWLDTEDRYGEAVFAEVGSGAAWLTSLCWCGSHLVKVKREVVRSGLTVSCGKPGCLARETVLGWRRTAPIVDRPAESLRYRQGYKYGASK